MVGQQRDIKTIQASGVLDKQRDPKLSPNGSSYRRRTRWTGGCTCRNYANDARGRGMCWSRIRSGKQDSSNQQENRCRNWCNILQELHPYPRIARETSRFKTYHCPLFSTRSILFSHIPKVLQNALRIA